MSAKAHYFKIGLFVIAGTILLVVGLVVLGAGSFFRDRLLLETYINESIQGVDVGTPVKFRGVPIGNVKAIDFVYNIYPKAMTKGNDFRYVYILMEVNPKALGNVGNTSIPAFLAREVNKGLRVGLTPQGLTGQFFLELDYYGLDRSPEPPIGWNPEHSYIPSTQSTITFFVQSIAEVFGRLERTNIAGLIDETSATLKSLHSTLDELNVAGVGEQTRKTLASVQQLSDHLTDTLTAMDLPGLASQTGALVASTREQIDSTGRQVGEATRKLGEAAEGAQRITDRLDQYLASEDAKQDLVELRKTLAAVRQTAETLPGSVNSTLGRADRLIESQQHDMEMIMENLRQASENLRALSERARDYPAQVLFGGPPPRQDQGAQP